MLTSSYLVCTSLTCTHLLLDGNDIVCADFYAARWKFALYRALSSFSWLCTAEGMQLEQRLGETPAQTWPTSNRSGSMTATSK